MASLFPIIAVLILAIYVSQTTSVEDIISLAGAGGGSITDSEQSIWSQTPYAEIRGGVQAILPLVIYLMIVLFYNSAFETSQ